MGMKHITAWKVLRLVGWKSINIGLVVDFDVNNGERDAVVILNCIRNSPWYFEDKSFYIFSRYLCFNLCVIYESYSAEISFIVPWLSKDICKGRTWKRDCLLTLRCTYSWESKTMEECDLRDWMVCKWQEEQLHRKTVLQTTKWSKWKQRFLSGRRNDSFSPEWNW